MKERERERERERETLEPSRNLIHGELKPQMGNLQTQRADHVVHTVLFVDLSYFFAKLLTTIGSVIGAPPL
jgi:hypothetical protein